MRAERDAHKEWRNKWTATEDIDAPSYFDSKEFRDYVALVGEHIHGLTVGQLHRALGDRARRDWTLDALGFLELDHSWVLPTRYFLRTRVKDIYTVNHEMNPNGYLFRKANQTAAVYLTALFK